MSAAIVGSTLAGRNSLPTRVMIPNESATIGAQVRTASADRTGEGSRHSVVMAQR